MKQKSIRILNLLLTIAILFTNVLVCPVIANADVNDDDANLAYIRIDGNGIYGFESSKYNYTVDVPYRYTENNFAIAMPEITAKPTNPDADVVVTPADDVYGGVATITVTSADGSRSNEYKLTLKPIGVNLYPNPGFEDGTVTGWSGNIITNGNAGVTNTGAYAGNYSAKIKGPRTADGTTFLKGFSGLQNVKHIASWAMKADFIQNGSNIGWIESALYPFDYIARMSHAEYLMDGTLDSDNLHWKEATALLDANYKEAGTDWRRQLNVFTPDAAGNSQFMYSTDVSKWEYDLYIDDAYMSELIVADVDISSSDDDGVVTIPEEKDVTVDLSAKLLNQFGNGAGLENETITWEIIGSPEGVSIDDGVVTITPYAISGVITIEATVTLGDDFVQDGAANYIDITLNAHGNKKPQARNVTITGDVAKDGKLSVDYRYYQVEGYPEEGTAIKWYYREEAGGTEHHVSDYDNKREFPVNGYENYLIYATITPRASNGDIGDTVTTDIMQAPLAPNAKDVTITYDARAIGEVLTGEYTYFDSNGDAENGTTFRWLRADTIDGDYTAITDKDGKVESGLTYTIGEEDAEKYIKFEVTPRTTVPPTGGEEEDPVYLSKPILAATVPVVTGVGINEISDTMLGAQYKYSHPNNIAEGATICNWYKDGALIHTGTSVELDDGDECTITLEVIPVASKAPFNGEPAETSITFEEKKHTVSYGGGGGGGSSSKPVIVPVPEPIVTPDENENPEGSGKEPTVYWASEAIKYVLDNNIMQNPKPDDFCDNDTVTRAEFVYYIAAAMGFGETEYKGEFADVTSDDWYANALQKAVDLGIISKADNFNPNREVSRDEICKILVESLGERNVSDEAMQTALNAFTDRDNIANWAVDYVKKAVALKLMNGVGNNMFSPKGKVTRAQTAVLIKRIAEYK